MAKQMLILKDSAVDDILDFFDKAERFGKKVKTSVGPQVDMPDPSQEQEPVSLRSVAYESRQLKNLLINLMQ